MVGWTDGWIDGWVGCSHLLCEGKVIEYFHFYYDICLLSLKQKHKPCSYHFVPNEICSGNFPPRNLKCYSIRLCRVIVAEWISTYETSGGTILTQEDSGAQKQTFPVLCVHHKSQTGWYQIARLLKLLVLRWVSTRRICLIPWPPGGWKKVDSVATGWKARGSNPGVFKKFSLLQILLDEPWGPPNLMYSGYDVSFRGEKWQGHAADHPLSSNTEVESE